MLTAAILVFVNVLFRFFDNSILWSEELIRYLIILLTFIGGSTGVREGSHYCIDLLPTMLKGKWKLALNAFIYAVGFVFSVFLTYYSWKAMQFVKGSSQLSPGLQIPMYTVYCIIPIAGLLVLLRYATLIIGLFRRQEEAAA